MSQAVSDNLSVDEAAAQIEGLFAQRSQASAEPDDADEPDEAPEGQPEETPEEEAPETEGEESEGTDEPEEETEEPVEVETVEDLAKQLDVPIAELTAKLKHTIKIDGEELQVTLDELVAGHQKDRDYRQKTEVLSREREAFTTQKQEVFERFHQEHTVLAQMIQLAEQTVVGEINSQEMANLRQTQPEMWAARRLELQDKFQQVSQVKQAAANQYVARQKELESEKTQALTKHLDEERKLLNQKIPQFDALKPKLMSYLTDSLGFKTEQLSGVTDHRLLIMADKAMKYDESQAKALSIVKNKVIPAPQKTLKPSKPMSKVAINRARIGSARNALKKSGSIDDAAKYVLASGLLKPKGPRK